jgi:hypothetical protein
MKKLISIFAIASSLVSSAWSAETIDVSDNHGGNVRQYDARWAEYGRQGVHVRIVGPCQSACTVLLAHIPRGNICVTRNASFGFHLAKSTRGTAILWNAYPADVQAWINSRGGLKGDFVWLRSPELYKYFRKC